jgi:hypothetical protein
MTKSEAKKKLGRLRKFAHYRLRVIEVVDGGGFFLVRGLCREPSGPEDDQWFEITSAYSYRAQYIGEAKEAAYLVGKLGIAPEYRTRSSSVCTIGYSEKKGAWYGWSHRAIMAFAVGAEDYETESKIYPLVSKRACRFAAAAFAESVS